MDSTRFMNALTRIAHLDVLLVISALALFPLPSSVGADDVAVTFGTPVKLGEGFGPIEGPAWDRKGALYFSSLSDGKIYRWSKEKGAVLFKQLEGGCNGLRFDAAGNLLVCQPRGRRVLRITPTGKHEVVVDRYKGGRLNSPNDIWIAPDGGVYFTDPRYGKGGELEQDGLYVFYLAPDGKTLVPMIKDLEKPNGIVGTADGKKLFVADPKAKKVYSYIIGKNGTVANRKVVADRGCDGLTVDEHGNLYLSGKVVEAYSPQGKVLARLEPPAGVSNLTFGGEDGRTLFCTSRAGIFAITMNAQGGSDPFAVVRDSQQEQRIRRPN